MIRGSERLGWDQTGASQAAVQGFRYVLYVDGTARSLSDVRCTAAATASGYPCSGLLPSLVAGAHVLELAAVDNGVEGPRSAPFRVTVSLTSLPVPTALGSISQGGIVCLDAGVDECYDAATLATADGDIADLTMAPDGRMFFVQNARAVRVIGAEGLAQTAALMASDDGERFVSLALSPDFEESRLVYVGSVEERRAGTEFSLRRYREVSGVFGQGAVLVTGLPVHEATARVPIAIDRSERLYVALPAADDSVARLSAFAFNGHVLRFERDGSVPADQSSPILARGYARPSAMVYDALESRMWVAGSSGTSTAPVAALTLDRTGSGALRPMAVSATLESSSARASLNPPSLALWNHGSALELWLARGEAYRGAVVKGELQHLQSVDMGLGDLRGVAATSQGLVVVVRQSATGSLGSEIVRLTPRSSALIQ